MRTEFLVQTTFAVIVLIIYLFRQWHKARRREERRDYYRNDYLNSEAWKRKRYVVLKRDNWTCVLCGTKAEQVHHKKYARIIGTEPIHWLEPVCVRCHNKLHA